MSDIREKYGYVFGTPEWDAFREGWNAALDHVRETNGEGTRDYL